VLFITNAGDRIQALNAATGDLLWEYRRDLPAKLIAEGGNTLAKRNMALYGDKLFIAGSDAHLVALDAKTGKVIWDHTVARAVQRYLLKAHGREGFEAAERGGVTVLGDCIGLIEPQNIVSEAAHSREDAGVFSDA
jgi:hypothetical protein